MTPQFSSDAAVTIELITHQPWADGETLTLNDVSIGPTATGSPDALFRACALVQMADDVDAKLIARGRKQVRAALDLLKHTLSGYPIELGPNASVHRRNSPGGTGVFEVSATGSVVNSTPLSPKRLEDSKRMAATLAKMNATQQRRSRAAAYWLRESNEAPDAAQRLVAACFWIEAAMSKNVEQSVDNYLTEVAALGFALDDVIRERLSDRIKRILDLRADIVHYGNLDSIDRDPACEEWARDLALAVMRRKVGLEAPLSLCIINVDE